MPITCESWVALGPEAEELCGSCHEERVDSYHPLEQVTLSFVNHETENREMKKEDTEE